MSGIAGRVSLGPDPHTAADTQDGQDGQARGRDPAPARPRAQHTGRQA
ncbi:hypothetical protein ACFC09_18565 [Streptomyces sp. NPDC056161]